MAVGDACRIRTLRSADRDAAARGWATANVFMLGVVHMGRVYGYRVSDYAFWNISWVGL